MTSRPKFCRATQHIDSGVYRLKKRKKEEKKNEKRYEILFCLLRFLQTPNTIVGRFLITKFLK